MAFYIVWGRPKMIYPLLRKNWILMEYQDLDHLEKHYKMFDNAKIDQDNYASWIEKD